MKGLWVEVTGTSMKPYLVAGDKVHYQKDIAPSFGDVVVFKNQEGKLVIHRYLGENRFKGDNLKRFDQEYEKSFELVGTATHRLKDNANRAFSQGTLVRFLSFCSEKNHAGTPFFHRFYAFMVFGLGLFLRYTEDLGGKDE